MRWLLVFVYSGLMAKEFFIGHWLSQRIVLYAVSHMVVLPMAVLWMAQFGAGQAPLSERVYLLCLISLCSGFSFEIGRKTRAPEEERPTVDSYSKALGLRGAVALLLVLSAAMVALLLPVLRDAGLVSAALLVPLLLPVVPLLRFLRQPTPRGSKHIQGALALQSLVAYLACTFTVVAQRGCHVALAVLEQAAVLAAGEARVGGKALGLGRLVAAGARVPPFCAVATEAFQAHLSQGTLQQQVEAMLQGIAALDPRTELAEVERRAAALRQLVEAAPLDEALVAQLQAALGGLEPGPFAVRSSMVGEDSGTRSFAGQLDSYLYQRAEDVPRALVRCWASCFTARALVYRARHGEAGALPRMGVVIQRMIAGRSSGVLFTRNPVNGRADQALLSACWGCGEGVVSGRCNSDEFLWDHAGREGGCTIADKDLQIVHRQDGTPGTEELAVAPELRRQRCLSPAEVAQIAGEALRIAEALGGPQDLEWTLAPEGLFFVQARPITAVGAAGALMGDAVSAARPAPADAPGEPDGPVVVWDNSNIQESYCGVTTPLTFSFARRAYASVYEQTMRIARLPEDEIASARPMLEDLLGLLSGRVYYNINNWYRMLQYMPSFRRNKEDMEKMMGLDRPVDFITSDRPGLLSQLRKLPRFLVLGVRMAYRFAHMGQEVARFCADFEVGYRRVDRGRLASASFSELMALQREVQRDILGRWHTPIINDIYVMMSSGRLRRLVERAVGPEEAPALMANLMGGEEGIESTEPTRQLLRMSAAARKDPALAALLRVEATTLPQLRQAHPGFTSLIDQYIERYGDRCMGELKLETVSLREDPSFLLRLLRSYLDRGDLDADAIAQKEKRLRAEAEDKLQRAIGALAFRRARGTLQAARTAVKHRENMRLLRTRLFGLVRDLYRAVGDRLHAAGRLEQPRDVFYLTVDELDAYQRGTAVSADTAALARARKAEYAGYRALELPHRLETRGPVYHGNPLGTPLQAAAASTGALLLRGTGCYPGVVEAPARVILDPSDDLSLAGRILVTLRTDPGWAPLFPLARGILVERGSTLSHSAILARELGIPAIVGVPDLLRQVRDGDALRLDGAAGTVERLEAR